MPFLKKYWGHLLAGLILLAGILTPVALSDRLGYCINHQGHYPATQNPDNEPPGVLIPANEPIRIFISCTGGFANANGAGITALATVLLMFVTGGLAWIARQQYVTTRAQLRAYLLPVSAGISGAPDANVTFKNSGQTPAYDVFSHIYMAVIPMTDEDRLLVIHTVPTDVEFCVGAGEDIPRACSYGRALTPAEITGISVIPPTHGVYVYGRIVYKDTFKQPHFSDFRYFYVGAWPPAIGGLLNVSKKGNNSD